jgi:hypothetical protein
VLRNVLPLFDVKTFATVPSTAAYSLTCAAASLAGMTVAVWALGAGQKKVAAPVVDFQSYLGSERLKRTPQSLESYVGVLAAALANITNSVG